jgi:hypothetical protein
VPISNFRRRAFPVVLVSLPSVGCHPGSAATSGAKAPTAQASIHPSAVPDEAFGASVHRLLRDGKQTPERLSLLAGVVSRQLSHAGERFAARQQERGLASLTGAFLLVRAGEFRMEMVNGGEQALASALSFVAPRGDEGRAVAFLMMQNALVKPGTPAKRDNEEHLAALKAWMHDTRGDASLEALGSVQRVSTLRSLVEPTTESMNAARDATVKWIEQSLRA